MYNINWFIRFPNQKKVNKSYIINCCKSLDCSFAHYFLNGYKQFENDYRRMLKYSHVLMTSDGYSGNTKSKSCIGVPLNDFRNEIVNKIDNPILKKEWYKEELKNYKQKRKVYNIKVKNINNRYSATVEDVGNGLKLYLPRAKYIDIYIKNMFLVMEQLRALSFAHLICGQSISKRKLIKYLGHYIHLFAICHPFEKVNFSICMAQVNWILNLFELPTVNHEYLDFKCFMNTTNGIVKELNRMIKNASK